MNVTEGKNVKLYVYRDGAPVLTVCATNISKALTAEKINVTTVDSGRENEYIGGSTDAEFTLDGVRTLNETTEWQADDFEDNIGELLHIILIYETLDGSILSFDTNVLVTGVSDSNDVADFSTYSVSLVRSGSWIKLTSMGGILVDGGGNPILDGSGNYITVI